MKRNPLVLLGVVFFAVSLLFAIVGGYRGRNLSLSHSDPQYVVRPDEVWALFYPVVWPIALSGCFFALGALILLSKVYNHVRLARRRRCELAARAKFKIDAEP